MEKTKKKNGHTKAAVKSLRSTSVHRTINIYIVPDNTKYKTTANLPLLRPILVGDLFFPDFQS